MKKKCCLMNNEKFYSFYIKFRERHQTHVIIWSGFENNKNNNLIRYWLNSEENICSVLKLIKIKKKEIKLMNNLTDNLKNNENYYFLFNIKIS